MQTRARLGLVGRWQAGNLKQFSLMPSAHINLENSKFNAVLNANYQYLNINGFNVVNDLWVNALYQHKPKNRVFFAIHSNNGFATSYKIDFSSLSGVGMGINLLKKTPSKYFQAHLISGYLNFVFENQPIHSLEV